MIRQHRAMGDPSTPPPDVPTFDNSQHARDHAKEMFSLIQAMGDIDADVGAAVGVEQDQKNQKNEESASSISSLEVPHVRALRRRRSGGGGSSDDATSSSDGPSFEFGDDEQNVDSSSEPKSKASKTSQGFSASTSSSKDDVMEIGDNDLELLNTSIYSNSSTGKRSQSPAISTGSSTSNSKSATSAKSSSLSRSAPQTEEEMMAEVLRASEGLSSYPVVPL